VVVARCPENRYFNELPHWKGLKFTWHTKNIRPHGGAMPTIREEEEEEEEEVLTPLHRLFRSFSHGVGNYGTPNGARGTGRVALPNDAVVQMYLHLSAPANSDSPLLYRCVTNIILACQTHPNTQSIAIWQAPEGKGLGGLVDWGGGSEPEP